MAYKRLLKLLFICLFSFLLMSHNSSAISPVYDLSNYDRIYSGPTSQDCVYDDTTFNQTNVWSCYLYRTDKNLRVIRTNRTFDIKAGDIVTFDVVISSNTSFHIVSDLKGLYTEYPAYSLIDMNIINGDYYQSVTSNGVIDSGYTIRKVYRYTYVARIDTTWSVGVGDANQNNFSFAFTDGSTSVSGFNLRFDLRDVTVWRSLGTKENQEQAQATQDAADDSQDAGDDSTSDAEQATSSLLSTITGFFNAIISVNPSNCKFNSNLPFLPGNGEIDLCSISTPPIVQTLSSLVLVGLFIPFCIHMFNRFVSITESFQR